jgi:hypothetical protein
VRFAVRCKALHRDCFTAQRDRLRPVLHVTPAVDDDLLRHAQAPFDHGDFFYDRNHQVIAYLPRFGRFAVCEPALHRAALDVHDVARCTGVDRRRLFGHPLIDTPAA